VRRGQIYTDRQWRGDCLGLKEIGEGKLMDLISFSDNKNVLKLTAVMAEQICTYEKSNKLYTLGGRIVWYLNCITTAL
jgi:hypothetical protein